jgi:hypothetical protein
MEVAMKRLFSAIGWFALLTCSLAIYGNAQNSNLMPLSKNFTGAITRTSVELTLSSNAQCDQSQTLIPDGSKLVSQAFSMNTDSNGVGTFVGTASVVIPDGRVVLQGSLRGTIGVNTRCGANQSCRLPWHLEGLFETSSSSFGRSISRSTTNVTVPIFQGRLDGLIPTLPASVAKIGLAPDKPSYTVNEAITAVINNSSEMAIQAFDLKSFCSIVHLQIQNGNQWDDVGICTLKRLSFPTNISSGQRMDVLLPTSQMTPGIYRLALNFRFLESNTPISEPLVVFSPCFPITMQPPSNTVKVKADREAYQDRDPVVLKVTNEMSQTIVAADHKSYCSILYVQKQDGNNWVNVAPCLLLTQTRLVKINPGEEAFVKIANEDASSRLLPGTYRLELTYSAADGTGQPIGNPVTVQSSTFTVASKQ